MHSPSTPPHPSAYPATSKPPLAIDLAVLGVAIAWGASYPVAKDILTLVPVLVLIACRFAICAIVMGAIGMASIRSAPTADRRRALALGVVLFAVFACETAGIARTSASNAALIIALSALFTALLEAGLQRRAPASGVLIGCGLAITGVALLAGGTTPFGAGDALVLAAALLRGVMVVATQRWMANSRLSSAGLTALQSVTVTALAIGALVATSTASGAALPPLPTTPRFWLALGFLAVCCTIAAFFIQNLAVRRTGPTRVSLILGTEPLFGVAFAHALLGEAVTSSTIIGAVLIVCGTAIGIRRPRR